MKHLKTFENYEYEEENEKINSEEEFRQYANVLLKSAHGEDFDEDLATETIDDIILKSKGNWSVAVGMIQNSLDN